MPIRPEEKARYPADWKAISLRIRHERAQNRCECTGQCGEEHAGGRCLAPNGVRVVRHNLKPELWMTATSVVEQLHTCGEASLVGYYGRPIKIVLTVAHLDHTPEHCDDSNLLACCQRCHLRYDREHHAETRRRGRDKRTGQGSLFATSAPDSPDAS